MSITKNIALLASLALVAGCTTHHDKHLSDTTLTSACDFETGALFENAPHYLSEGKTNAPIGKLSRLFGNYDKSIDKVRITQEGNHLKPVFYDTDNNEIPWENESKNKEYSVDRKRFVINKWSSCKPGEAGVGCTWSHIELSCSQDNKLIIKEANGGAAMIALVIPLGSNSSYLGVYKRISEQ